MTAHTAALDDAVAVSVRTILAERTMRHPDDVQPDQTLASLGIDSLGMVEVIFALEEDQDISIPFNANENSDSTFAHATVAELIEMLRVLKSRSAG